MTELLLHDNGGLLAGYELIQRLKMDPLDRVQLLFDEYGLALLDFGCVFDGVLQAALLVEH